MAYVTRKEPLCNSLGWGCSKFSLKLGEWGKINILIGFCQLLCDLLLLTFFIYFFQTMFLIFHKVIVLWIIFVLWRVFLSFRLKCFMEIFCNIVEKESNTFSSSFLKNWHLLCTNDVIVSKTIATLSLVTLRLENSIVGRFSYCTIRIQDLNLNLRSDMNVSNCWSITNVKNIAGL